MKTQLIIKSLKKYLQIIIIITLVISGIVVNKIYNNYKLSELNELNKITKNIYLNKSLLSIFDTLEPRYQNIKYKVLPGDTFEKILISLGINSKEKKLVLKNLKNTKFDKLYENQIINFHVDRKVPIRIINITLEITKSKNLIVSRNISKNKFELNLIETNLKKKIIYEETKIANSLYKSAIDLNIPANVIIDFARIYGFQVDFQRDIWRNDSFQILYEKYLNDKNEIVNTGNIIFANLILQGREYPLYLFKSENKYDHYDNRGQSIKKTLMKTPVNGARLSSSFGKRKHPILGFTKLHTGTDFAAPKGTPIMASGDGVVTKASWCGGGGNCVKIKHNSIYQTVYAHMSKFGRNIKKGTRVKQGQIIGYVGSTGMSTGPHLHYEVIENGKKVNSQKLKLPSGKTLKGEERKQFEIVKLKTNVLKSELIFND
ncbi:MAG: peptidase M23 [Candidatus Pelagibacter sp.]|nr:peptidase M23 [Candidatus Pelagibacter sp.]|tara:strand:- start:3153 stop:4445 length:1293 start_codon:yes stop_codon:yes gene_type:complete